MQSREDLSIINSLKDALRPSLSKWYGVGAKLNENSARVITYPYSFFISFRVQLGRSTQTLLLKIHRKPHIKSLSESLRSDVMKKSARDEFEMTKVIWRAFNDENSPNLSTVQPFEYLAEWNAIAMRKIDGKLLKKYLINPSIILRRRGGSEILRQHLIAAASWLRIFHERIAGKRIELFPASDAKVLAGEFLGKLKTNSNGMVNITHYEKVLDDNIQTFKRIRVPVALLHDDFQYSNIMVVFIFC